MNSPFISVICTAFNQAEYISECIDSVLSQDYPDFELIIHDNGSPDNTKERIRKAIQGNEKVVFKELFENIGLPKAFNLGFNISKGDLLMDLSGDDRLTPGALISFAEKFEEVDPEYGVVYSNSELINEEGESLGFHFSENSKPPEGSIFSTLVGKYVISAPSMMFRKEVINKLGGYDENLLYEDFDFWVRSSREYKYAYLDRVNVLERQHSRSFSRTGMGKEFEGSTYIVCQKAFGLVQNEDELNSLRKRLGYHARQCILNGDQGNFENYMGLLKQSKANLKTLLSLQIMARVPFLTKAAYRFLKSLFSTKPT